MNILGIDTTTKSASCSILNNNKYYTKSISNEITHSEKLLPIIHEALTDCNMTLNDINILAAINGPGSFTGIRIGLATIKAFAQVKNMDIFSISSLDLISYTAFKETCTDEKYILSLIDAKNTRVYYSLNRVYMSENGKVIIENITPVNNDIIIDALNSIKEKIIDKEIIIAGDCVNLYSAELSKISNKLLDLYPSTENLIDCYLNIHEVQNYMYNAYSLDALYARPSQAERMSSNG